MSPESALLPPPVRDRAGESTHREETRDFLSAAIEWLPIGVIVFGADGVIVVANRQIEHLFGYGSGELVGQSVDMLVPDVGRAGHASLRQAFLEHPQARPVSAGRELFGRRKDGSEVAVEIGLSPIQLRSSTFVLASVIEVTERRGIEAGLQGALEDRLEFERLVGELGAEFVNLRPDDV